MKIDFKKLVGRLTGFSIPIFGVSWNPPEIDRDVAGRIITFLEDRRIIHHDRSLINYLGHHTDIPLRSILEIRGYLTKEMQRLARDSALFEILEGMRKACRACLEHFELADLADDATYIPIGNDLGNALYWSALIEFKTRMGLLITTMAVQYGIDIPEELVQHLPADADDEPSMKALRPK
jgi:hypothetical protein